MTRYRDDRSPHDRWRAVVALSGGLDAVESLPWVEWHTIAERQKARMAAARVDANRRHGKAQREVEAIAAANTAQPLPSHATDAEIRAAADRRAELMGERIASITEALTDVELIARVNAWLLELQARAFDASRWADNLRGLLRRVQAPEWWRRQLRRAVVRQAEGEAIAAGHVNATAGAWYCSHQTLRRRLLQNQRNAAILESTELENDAGEVFTLAALAAKSTANKAVRRGELMTRIRGCEEWADASGHAGVFLTLTAPSRFHSTLRASGKRNRAYRGATPAEAQAWLCARWARARAAVHRAGLQAYGFRVAEPHHDGCPHWHALVWVPGSVEAYVEAVRAAWLSGIDPQPYRWVHAKGCDAARDSDRALFRDFGAAEHRVKAKRMTSGDAAGYVAKYIAKNIDDAGAIEVEGHRDDEWAPPQRELFDNGAARVEAWASAWGIRQFQAIGQPPVTVWRELRRVPPDAVSLDGEGNGPARLAYALDAVNRREEDRADWCGYLQVQGGTGRRHDEWALRVALKREAFVGRYEEGERALPLGVYESDSLLMVESTRRKWRPRGAWGQGGALGAVRGSATTEETTRGAARAVGDDAKRNSGLSAPPWTRVNNCTRPSGRTRLEGLGITLAMPLEGWAGGLATLKGTQCAPPRPSRPT